VPKIRETVSRFAYDALGRRIRREESRWEALSALVRDLSIAISGAMEFT
jgi:hypothetical protein